MEKTEEKTKMSFGFMQDFGVVVGGQNSLLHYAPWSPSVSNLLYLN